MKRATISGAASGEDVNGVGAVTPLADLALGAGDFPAVVADAEVVAGVALLDAVLAGAVAGQRPGEGDPVLAPGPLHVHQGGVAAVHQVLAGEQAPALQPGVDPGQGLSVVAGGGHGGDVGDDVGPVFGAGLGHVGEVSRPAGDLAPAGVAGGQVIRGHDAGGGRRQAGAALIVAPAQPPGWVPVVVLDQDLPQGLHPGAEQQARVAGGQVLQQPAGVRRGLIDPGLRPGGVLAEADRAAVAAPPVVTGQAFQRVAGGAGEFLHGGGTASVTSSRRV